MSADLPAGLAIDTELRWSILQSLAANAAAGLPELEAKLAQHRTASGEREAALARSLETAEHKALVWERLTCTDDSNSGEQHW